MTTLKTIHDGETGARNRIKYDGENVYASFTLEVTASDGDGRTTTAVLDCLGADGFDGMDTTAYVDLEELREAYAAVRKVTFIDDVRTPFAEEKPGDGDD